MKIFINELGQFKSMQKGAQVQSQVFVYIMVLIVIGATILFGYDAITKLQKTGSQTQLEQSKSDLARDIERMSPNFGSEQKFSYGFAGVSKVCFGDFDVDEFPPATGCDQPGDNPLIQGALERGKESANIFLVGTSSFDSLLAGKINTGGVCKVKCFQTPGGRLNIKMTGKGDSVLVESQ